MLTPPPKHFKCHTAQPFPAPYEKLRQSLKYFFFKKKNPERLWPLLFDHDACCFHVQVDSSRFFSPSTDSEVVTALGWGCVHVTELRRGQVVCLVDGGTLQLLSQVPGLEDKKKSALRNAGACWDLAHGLEQRVLSPQRSSVYKHKNVQVCKTTLKVAFWTKGSELTLEVYVAKEWQVTANPKPLKLKSHSSDVKKSLFWLGFASVLSMSY